MGNVRHGEGLWRRALGIAAVMALGAAAGVGGVRQLRGDDGGEAQATREAQAIITTTNDKNGNPTGYEATVDLRRAPINESSACNVISRNGPGGGPGDYSEHLPSGKYPDERFYVGNSPYYGGGGDKAHMFCEYGQLPRNEAFLELENGKGHVIGIHFAGAGVINTEAGIKEVFVPSKAETEVFEVEGVQLNPNEDDARKEKQSYTDPATELMQGLCPDGTTPVLVTSASLDQAFMGTDWSEQIYCGTVKVVDAELVKLIG